MTIKRLIYFFSAIIFCLFLLVASLPTILSTKWAQTNYNVPMIENSYGGRISIGEASFSWLGSQKIKNFRWNDTQTEIEFQSLSLDAPFYIFLYSRTVLHPAKLENLNIHLSDQIHLEGFDGDIMFKEGAIHLLVNGITTQNELEGKLEISGQIPFSNQFPQGKLTAKMENFPSRFLIIPVTPAKIPLYEFLGQELNGTLTYENGVIDVIAATTQGSADFSIQFVDNGVTFPRDGKISYKMPEKAVKQLEHAGLIALHSPLTLQLVKGEYIY